MTEEDPDWKKLSQKWD